MEDKKPLCAKCGSTFVLGSRFQEQYPGWSPKLCSKCFSAESGSMKGLNQRRASGGRGIEVNLTTAEILQRFTDGPDSGIFTDGACTGNPGPGGWGTVRVRAGEVVAERHGSDPNTTNNRMELRALIEGLRLIDPEERIAVYSDSMLVVNTLMKWAAGWQKRGWRRKSGEVKNLELVKEAFALLQARPHVTIEWIRAHDGSRWNEYADSLATAFRRAEI